MLRKSKASIAFPLVVLILAALTIPVFLFIDHYKPPHPPRHPPLAKWIDVGIFCQETSKPVPDGLAVRCIGENYEGVGFTKNGHVLFGSGLVDGTFTISWYWGKEYTYGVTINCSRITWKFDYYVPNPTITKHFKYDTKYGDYPPVVGLHVSLYDSDELVVTLATDDTGTVVFDGHYVDVCHEYYLKWLWGGEEYKEGPIHFIYEEGKLLVVSWEDTNKLPAKSGGGELG
jgi:hypothetical protein